MTNTKKKLLKQISSLALCLCMILSCLPISAFAESQDGTCEHHHEHTAECGYVAAVEGQPCTHECSEECAEGCVHEHDDTCGYVAAVEGSPCKYECEEDHGEEETTESTEASAPAYTAEDVKAMIDALPDVSELENMDNDELSEVHDKAQDAYDAFEALTDEEQIELANDLVKLRDVLDFMTTPIAPLATEAETLGNGASVYTSDITYSDGVSQFFTYNSRLYKITYTNLNWTTVCFYIDKHGSDYYLKLLTSGQYRSLFNTSSNTLRTSDIPTTQGAELIGYDANRTKVATITCLALNNSPTWNWASDYSTASAVFTAKDYDVQVTVSATVSSKVTKYATKCTEKNTVEYTATASFGGISGTDTRTVANGNIGPHSLTYSASGNTITEYCGNNCGHKQTATLSVDSSVSLLYTGSAIKPVKLEYSSDWLGGELEIKYADDCINQGSHSASITIGGATATQSFEIATPTVVTKDNYTSLGLNSSYVGYYAISTLAELKCFAALVVQNPSVNAVLMRDIDATSTDYIGIGKDADHAFAGTFDGNNKTLKIALVSTEQYVAPFPHVNGATIKNLTVSGTIKTTHKFAAGIVGRVESGNAKLENCLSLVEIDSTNYSGDGTHGGLIGVVGGNGTITINNCGFAGSIIGETTTSCGGIVGWAGSNVKISNSFVAAEFTLQNNSGDTFARNQSKVTVTNCYYLNALSDTMYSGAKQTTAEQFKSGEVAYKLNNGVTDGTQAWYQTCQSDSYPKFSGKTVYRGYICGSGSSEPIYGNSMDGLIAFASPEHQYNASGVCKNCGQSKSAVWDGIEQVYKIYNLGQLQWFADKVNAGETNINGKLMADIDASSLKTFGIGTSTNKYAGIFDGNGYTLTLGLNSTAEYAALFPYVNNATIKSLIVKGSITTNQKFAASIVGMSEGTTKIENCLSYVTITSNVSGDGTHGGLVANVSSGTITINNCGFVGAINGSGTDSCGGLVGWSNGTTKISNSFIAATFSVSATNGNTFSRGNNITVTNCYYLNALGDAPSEATQKNADQFSSGEVAWLLNGSDNGVWKQTLKTDTTPNFGGKAVYRTTPCETGYTNNEAEKSKEHNYNELNCCTVCGKLKLNADGYYEIDTIEKLFYFAQRVNAGEYGINGKLIADIDASALKTFGIGTSENPYNGIFDGNGYTLTLGLNSTAQYTAPFPYVNGATIKSLTVKGSITTNQKFAASIVGMSTGTTTIENCLSYVTINSSVCGDGTHGGFVANVSSGTMTIKNCGFVGAIYGDKTSHCGGLVGYSSGTTNIENSYVAANFDIKSDGSSTFARGNNVTIMNCYYLYALGTAQGEKKSADQFASGEVAWLLNGSTDNGTWNQFLGVDKTPNFSGESVYKTTPCESYTNNESEKNRDHVEENGVCKYCGKLINIIPAIWNDSKQAYEIHSAAQLVWFSKLVNGTLDGVDQNQSANAILMADIDMSAVTDYVPIGGTTGLYYSTEGEDKGYQGIFDGNGHVIKNLSVKGSDTEELTYGVFGTLSETVKHLGVENFTFTLGSQDCRAGGIAGQILSGGLIEDCYVANSTITATGKVAGGIAGCNYAGTIKNCFTYKVTVTATRTGGIVGDNCGDNDSDRKGSVINCYTDASAIENSSRKGNVSSSTASMSVSDFASGYVGYLLDGSRNFWRQTIGSHYYPIFSGNAIKIDGFNITGTLMSAKITWTAMEFTYTAGGSWDPITHSYNGNSEGIWKAVNGGGTVTVENLGASDIYANFAFSNSISGIAGTFDIEDQCVPGGGSVTSKLTLSGTPTGESFNNSVIGSATITLRKNKNNWKVGDIVDWTGTDGKVYKCVVLSRNDNDDYVLITSDAVKKNNGYAGGSFEEYEKGAQAAGARLPSPDSTSEKNYLEEKCGKNRFYKIPAKNSSGTLGKYGYLTTGKYNFAVNYSDQETYYIYYVFDVPAS